MLREARLMFAHFWDRVSFLFGSSNLFRVRPPLL